MNHVRRIKYNANKRNQCYRVLGADDRKLLESLLQKVRPLPEKECGVDDIESEDEESEAEVGDI